LLKISAALRSEFSLLSETPVIMVIGEVDTGKSTLVALVAEWFRESGKKVAVVDSDIGQAEVGPPGFVSYGFAQKEVLSLASIPRQGSYMVGKTSPYGRELSVLVGVQSCVRAARVQGAQVIIIDTCGFVVPAAGVQLKCAKAEAIQPDIVIGLSTSELVSAVDTMRSLGFRVREFKPLSGARKRSAQERGQNRVCCWNRYAGKEARTVDVDLSKVRVLRWWGETRYSDLESPEFGCVAAVPDPHMPGLQLPCIWMRSGENTSILGQLPEDYTPDVVWLTSYKLGIEEGRVTSA